MTLNKDQAQHDNRQLYDDAVQSEIRAVLSQDGPCFCGQVARAIDKPPQETRWHLTELLSRGEISYNWATQRYDV